LFNDDYLLGAFSGIFLCYMSLPPLMVFSWAISLCCAKKMGRKLKVWAPSEVPPSTHPQDTKRKAAPQGGARFR